MRAISIVLCSMALASAASATEPIVYPDKGQSSEQQERDQYECHEWATKETGVDPVALAESKFGAATPASEDEGMGGGTGGAGLGAARSAMEGGDAAAGAARGFGIGRMIKVIRAKRQLREQQSADSSEATAMNDQLDKYDRAYAACLTGRGYTVK